MAPIIKKVEKVIRGKKVEVEEKKPAIDRQIEDLQRKMLSL